MEGQDVPPMSRGQAVTITSRSGNRLAPNKVLGVRKNLIVGVLKPISIWVMRQSVVINVQAVLAQ